MAVRCHRIQHKKYLLAYEMASTQLNMLLACIAQLQLKI